ncbi:MAG: transporter permease ATP-binding protein [Herbaspirillum sp.]|jgi:polar amino acid transport system permease protein|nr:transporter permease ATP-binding protein [Herbaspirillum sp.]
MELFFHYLTLDYLQKGVALSVGVTSIGLLGGLVLGLILASMQMARYRLLSGCARLYAVIFRGTPLILQMVFFYDALPLIGIKMSALVSAGIALACNEAPFIAEMLRSGVRGVDRGQVLAGEALGMSPFTLMRHIVAPQALRNMIPGFGNEAVSALKNSSLASFISVQELTLRSTQLASSTFDFFSVFFASGLLYLFLAGVVTALQLLAEYVFDLDRTASRHPLLRRLAAMRKGAAGPGTDDAIPVAKAVSSIPITAPRASVAPGEMMVEVKNLTKRFGDQTIFSGLNLKVQPGEVVALLGPSGSGKSTLLRCINRLEAWNAGDVHIHGQRVGFADDGRPLTPREVARQRAHYGVGMVFQHFNLFAHLTALDNIAGPLRWVHGVPEDEAKQRALELLERVGLLHRAHALPRHLSGGQQQRIAIARALAPQPSVLLLDEPTSALDPELVNEVLEVIQKLAVEDGLTMIISTHQLRFAKEVANRVIFLSGGVVAEDGPTADVLSRPKNPLTARFLSVMGNDANPVFAL